MTTLTDMHHIRFLFVTKVTIVAVHRSLQSLNSKKRYIQKDTPTVALFVVQQASTATFVLPQGDFGSNDGIDGNI